MNSKESLDYATKIYQELQENGHNLMRRAITFCAALALNQGHPSDALETLVGLKNQNYVTVRNLKVCFSSFFLFCILYWVFVVGFGAGGGQSSGGDHSYPTECNK